MALSDWLQRMGGLTLEATILGADAVPGPSPCPSCAGPLYDVAVRREVRLFGVKLSSHELMGYRCSGGHSFIRQGGFARWLDVALMAPVVLLLAGPLVATAIWVGKAAAAGSATDALIAFAFFAAAALIFVFPALSLRRRLRIARRNELSWMDETFTASS